MIAFFGTGLVGSGFVRAMRRRGETVHVWNRTASKARALEVDGARAFDSPAEAAAGATRVHLSLSDDASVDVVLEQALPSLMVSPADVTIIDHTTTSASGTVVRIDRWNDRGIAMVHAPVFMGPQNALEATGMMLVSGERARVNKVKPFIEPMTGKVIDLGDRPDAAAAFKLLGNLFLMFFTGGLAEVFTLARAMNVDPHVAATLFDQWSPGLTIRARMDRMLAANWDKPSWELGMARKDARLMLDEATRAACPLTMLPAIAARMDALIAQGHGAQDWTVLAIDALGGLARKESSSS